MIIDAHHHLWRFAPAEYPWIADAELRHDFTLPDLHAELDAAGIAGTVAVQARQSMTETAWLLGLGRQSPRIRGVVGWLPLADPGIDELLPVLAEDRLLVAGRHVVQDEPDPGFLLRPDIGRGLSALAAHGLAYDLLVRGHQLPQAIACVDAHPDQRFILDHAGKPRFADGLEPWAGQIRELARRPNVWCKLSGLASEAGPAWGVAWLRPWIDVLLDAFGPRRLMFGSDWPVCLPATGYGRWLSSVQALIASLTTDERAAILGATASTAYRLEPRP